MKTYGYNRKNQVVMEKDADGNITRYYYDRLGNPTGYMNPNQALTDGKRTRFIYNKLDKLESVVTAEGNVHHYIYGIHNKVVRKVHPNAFSYDHMDAEGTSYDYDIFDRKIRERKVNGGTKRFFYDANGNLIKLVMPEQYKEETDDGAGYLYEYDSCNRLVKETAPDGTVQKVLKYDLMGNMVRSTDANGFCVQYHYDVRGNMTARIDPSGARESFEYDKENRQTGHTDRNGSRIRTDYNMYGSITRRVAYKADSEKTKNAGIGQVTESYGYLPDGKLSYAISNGMRYDYTHDCMGRLIRKTASGRTLIENTYDLNGNRIRLVDITGKECNYHYDLLDRIESISGNQKEYVTYQYNDDGTLKRMVVGGNLVTEYTYDADKNVAGQRTYVENSWEKGTALLSGGSLQAEYERRQQQKEALAAKAARRSRYLQHAGQVGTGNGDLAGDGSLDNLSLGALLGNANVIVNNTYTYDLLGHMTSKETLSGLTEYTYDKLGQITRAATSGRLEEFQYDPAGNRIGRRSASGNGGKRQTDQVLI